MLRQIVRQGLILLFLSLTALLFAQPVLDATSRVKSINVEGTQKIAPIDVLTKLDIKVGDTYDRVKIRGDIKKIYDMGYFSEVAVDATPQQDGVNVVFLVKENPLVKGIYFEGNKAVKTKRIKADLDYKENQHIYWDGIVDKYIEKIKSIYKEKQVVVDVKGKKEDVDAQHVNLRFVITEEEKNPRIKEIRFEGNQAIKDKKLKKMIESKNSWLFVSHYYDSMVYEDDVAKIENAFKNKGYVLVKVKTETPQYDSKRKGVVLVFRVEEGPQYSNGSISAAGNALYTTAEIASTLKQVTGKTYSQLEMEKDAQRLFDLYANQGYIATDVVKQLNLDNQEHKVNILYQIQERPRIYLGDVRFVGVSTDKDSLAKTASGKGFDEVPLKTKDYVLRREVTMDKGDILKKSSVQKTQRELNNLGFFDRVVPIDEPTLADDTRDLVVYLMEKRTGMVQFGVGYSTNKKAEVFVDLEESNIFGTGRSVRLKADLAQEGSEYYINYTEPYVLGSRADLNIKLFRESLDRTLNATQYSYDGLGNMVVGEGISHDYSEVQTGGSIGISYPYSQDLKLTLDLSAKNTKLDPDEDTYVIPDPLGPSDIWTNSLTPGVIYDTRDNRFYPTRGVKYVGSMELASELFGGDVNFIKLYGEGNWFKKVARDYVGALRLRGGYLKTMGDTEEAPISDRFFLGGPSSLRGFDYRGVSPSYTYNDTTNHELVDLIVGGEFMLNMNLEVRRKFSDFFTGLVFFDAGGVWQKVEDFDASQIRYSVGPGVMLNLPIGNFQFGFGIPLNAQTGDEKQNFYFTFGNVF